MNEQHDAEVAMWRAAVAALLARRYPRQEAFESASLLLAAYRRCRAESRGGAQAQGSPAALPGGEAEGARRG